MMWVIFLLLVLYILGMFLAIFTTELADRDTKLEKFFHWVGIFLWPLVTIIFLTILVYDATIGNYLWKRQHRKWVNE